MTKSQTGMTDPPPHLYPFCPNLGCCYQLGRGHSSPDTEENSEVTPGSAPPLADQGGSPSSPELHGAIHPPWDIRAVQNIHGNVYKIKLTNISNVKLVINTLFALRLV